MRFGFWAGASNPWAEVLTVARHAERTGWDRIWFADHFMPNKPVGEDVSDELGTRVVDDAGRVRGSYSAGQAGTHGEWEHVPSSGTDGEDGSAD